MLTKGTRITVQNNLTDGLTIPPQMRGTVGTLTGITYDGPHGMLYNVAFDWTSETYNFYAADLAHLTHVDTGNNGIEPLCRTTMPSDSFVYVHPADLHTLPAAVNCPACRAKARKRTATATALDIERWERERP